ncbi:hypothetical protein PHYSODRAFT_298157 [Phytophthora sojae]|uniref:Nudix hydrolase domain-containing protein n=1 Tax=Phytophthora sojae (strain P6497) TaxID=1094619 RepID=G4Z8U7_PHYSP|nr:hypothetical protein PHYSODRAFT_298157 [Phytophthora sojae]EGZ19718.1 hypothetical protein PHYSODRAFT_298157 [Phytophthora sojae]|eukprot:XP_009522435.1 hypothetical protein PHYSODRAFT_298157 [Phytophthora sojae]
MQHYPKGLSTGALKEFRAAETKRFLDFTLFGKVDKKNPAGLLRPMEGVDPSKVAPKLESLVGRENQVLDEVEGVGRRVVCNVVMRPESEGGGILLISSSKLDKQDFILPKGGVEQGERGRDAAVRDVLEEGGVRFS